MRSIAQKESTAFDKEKHTILIPDMFPVHMELLAEVLRADGYRVEVLHYDDRAVLDTGLKYIHNDMCYPAICSVGQLLYAVTCGDYDTKKVALLQFQTGGGCRASNYVMLLKKALQKLQLSNVPIITLGFTSMRGSGLHITPRLFLRAFAALTYGDMLMLLSNQIRPYEHIAGETQRLAARWSEKLKRELHGVCISMGRMKRNLRAMAKEFSEICVDRKEKVKVGVVGEVYVKYSPLANNRLEEFLQSQDCEYMLPGVLSFIHYCLSTPVTDRELYGGSRVKSGISRMVEGVIERYETALSSTLREFPRFVCPASFREMQSYGDQIIGRGMKMGEGWYLPAEMVELIRNGYENIICTQPFGCLPNHIVGKGVVRRFRELYPRANICAIDYDASASAVNQENRIKLLLAMAKDQMKTRCVQTVKERVPQAVDNVYSERVAAALRGRKRRNDVIIGREKIAW